MTTEIGHASLGIIPSFDGFERNLERGTTGGLSSVGTKGGVVFGDAAGKSAGQRFGSLFKSAAKASLIGLAGAGALAVKLGIDSVSAASDLEESTNKVAQVFGKNADAIFKFTEKAGDALGQTNTQARNAAATFGIFGNAAGLADRKNAKFAKQMTTLASDLASFHNTDPEQAVEALGAALRGESEPIRSYGVLLDEATLKAEALRLGLLKPVQDESKILASQVNVTVAQKNYNEAVKESGPKSLEALKAQAALGTAQSTLQKATEGVIEPLTQQQKLLAAQSQIFKQTEVAQGDFARTSDGLANQQRRLSARFEDAKAKLGTGLLPIMTEAADFLLDEGIPAFEDFSDWFVDKGIPKLEQFGNFAKDDLLPILSDVADFAGDAAEFLGDVLKVLNDLPSEAKLAALGAVVGGVGAAKLSRGGSGVLGKAGTALGIASAAKPLPVFVTNWAQIAAGGFAPDGTPVVTTDRKPKPGGPKNRPGGGFIRGVGITLAAAAAFAFGDDAADSYMDGFERNSKWADKLGRNFKSNLGGIVKDAVDSQVKIAKGFEKAVPETLQTRFRLLGVPDTEKELRHLLRVYDIAAKDRRTTLELMGYDPMLDRIARINAELDWAARPREARINITKAYSAAGYETRGGLQEGGGGPVARNRRRGAGGFD